MVYATERKIEICITFDRIVLLVGGPSVPWMVTKEGLERKQLIVL